MKRNVLNQLRLLLPLVAAILLTLQQATAQTTIAVVSDPHVMAPSLLDDQSNTAWVADYASQRKMLVESNGLFEQLVATLSSSKPDILLITGDLTKDGEMASHKCVRDGLKKLKDAGVKVYVIPGNHDYGVTAYKYANNAKKALSAAKNTEMADDPASLAVKKMNDATSFSSYYSGYGYGEGCTVDPNGSNSYVTEPVTGLVLLAMDSHSGSIGEKTLDWICSQASQARANGKQVIAMMHHPLFPHIYGVDVFIDTYTVGDYENVRNKLINAGVNVILTGHFHASDIAKDWNNDANKVIYDINTGSLISYPCDYRMLTLSADMMTLEVTTASLVETKALTPAGATSWKTWLTNRVSSIANAKMRNYLKNEVDRTALANFAANAFVLHAEGDEETKDAAATLLNDYDNYSGNELLFNMAKALLSTTFHSMLENTCNYETEKASVTADRTLTIPLLSPDVLNGTVTLSVSGWPLKADGIYTLQGTRADILRPGIYIQRSANGKRLDKGRKIIVNT